MANGLDAYDNIRRPPETPPIADLATPTMGAPSPMGGFQLPDVSIREERGGGSETYTKMAPAYKTAIEAEQAAFDPQIKAKEASVVAERARAAEAERMAEERAKRAEADAKAIEVAEAEENRKIQEKIAAYDSGLEELKKNAKPTGYFEKQGAMAEVYSAFIVGLSERYHRMAGGRPGESPMQVKLDRAIAQDTKDQMLTYERSKEFVALQKEAIGDAITAKAEKLASIKNRQLASLDILEKKSLAYAAKINTPEAIAKAESAVGEMRQKQAELAAERNAILNVTGRTEKPKTSTTTNIMKDGGAAGGKPASVIDVEKRTALQEAEKANREISSLLKNSPKALDELREAEQHWATMEASGKIPIVGPLGGFVRGAVGLPMSKDAYLKDASPEARTLNEKIEVIATARAKAMGGVVTEGDRAAVKAQLGLMGKTAKEISEAAVGYADEAKRARMAIESQVQFSGDAQTPATTQAQKDAALRGLITVTSVKGAGQAAIESAAQAAKVAGWPEAMIDSLVGKKKKKR